MYLHEKTEMQHVCGESRIYTNASYCIYKLKKNTQDHIMHESVLIFNFTNKVH